MSKFGKFSWQYLALKAQDRTRVGGCVVVQRRWLGLPCQRNMAHSVTKSDTKTRVSSNRWKTIIYILKLEVNICTYKITYSHEPLIRTYLIKHYSLFTFSENIKNKQGIIVHNIFLIDNIVTAASIY